MPKKTIPFHLLEALMGSTAIVAATVFFLRAGDRTGSEKLTRLNRDLRESRDSFRLLVNSVKDYAIFSLGPAGIIRSWNPGAESIKGYKAEEIIGRHFSEFYPAEDRAAGKPDHELREAVRQGSFHDEGWRIRKDGSRFWAHVLITPMLDDDGKLDGFSKITHDLTEQKLIDDRLEAANRDLEARVADRTQELTWVKDRLELALDAAHMGTWDHDLRTGDIRWSGALKRIFGYAQSDCPGKADDFTQRIHPEDRLRVREAVERSERARAPFNAEYRVTWPDGSTHWIEAKARVTCDERGAVTGMLGTAINIDERKRYEENLEAQVRKRTEELALAQAALVESAKMSALGEMAGGIAHEVNTPLTTITLKAQQLERRARALDPASGELFEREARQIADTATRIGAIIKGLRSFAREGKSDPVAPTSPDQIVNNVLSLCQARFRSHHITLEYVPPAHSLSFECRPVQIEQVLINLLNNSFDAVQELTEKWIRIEAFAEHEQIVLAVSDSGHGIPPQLTSKIMQPFFTTKEIGKGTGLGLSISKGIIEAHHGRLYVDRDSPHTRFVAQLPRSHASGENP